MVSWVGDIEQSDAMFLVNGRDKAADGRLKWPYICRRLDGHVARPFSTPLSNSRFVNSLNLLRVNNVLVTERRNNAPDW